MTPRYIISGVLVRTPPYTEEEILELTHRSNSPPLSSPSPNVAPKEPAPGRGGSSKPRENDGE